MIKLVQQLKQTTQLKWNRVAQFKPTIRIEFEMGPYIVKTADSQEELIHIFRLRHEVFYREFRNIATEGLDIDKFDRRFDHLIIYHKPTNAVIGTYRLRSSQHAVASYTAQEFDLSRITLPGPYLELGRACIHQNHRKGSVISLLFRGIAEYMNRSEAKILFGCSSVKTHDPRQAALIYQCLVQDGVTLSDGAVHPTSAFRMPKLKKWLEIFSAPLTEEQRNEAEDLIPSLVKSYIKMGAKIACEPAFDKDFACIDLLTLLRRENLTNTLARRFQVVPDLI